MEINDRIRYLRKSILNITQQEFSDSLKISRSNEGNIEIGRIAVTERVISDICDKWHVNRSWLEHGEGDPLVKPTRNQLITDFVGDVINDDDGSFRKRLVEALAKLDLDDWEYLEKIAKKITKKEG